jgi:hypothetical protein
MTRRKKPDPYLYDAMLKRPASGGPGVRGVDTDCGKKGYDSQEDVEVVMRHREEESGDKLDIYACEKCGYWHLTSAAW